MQLFLLLLTMLFCHLVDDYYLQGFLASAKQRSWWEKNYPDEIYCHDYKVALLEHAYSWTFVIHIPIFFVIYLGGYWKIRSDIVVLLGGVFLVNWLIHAVVDHLKANRKRINLVIDQTIHIVQVIAIWAIYVNTIF